MLLQLYSFPTRRSSDLYPVDKVSCSYTVLWNSFKRLTSGYSPVEKAHLFHSTAQRVYRLGDRKSTRLNSSHVSISYAVFCLKKKNNSRVFRCSTHSQPA